MFWLFIWSYLAVLVFAAIAGLNNFARLNKAFRILSVLLTLTAVSEITSRYCAYRFGNNSQVFHIFNVLEFSLLAAFFIRNVMRKARPGVLINIVFIIAAVAGYLNCIFLQPFDTINSNFLLAESFIMIALALYALYKLFINNDDQNVLRSADFWPWACLLLYFSSTFFFWPVLKILDRNKSPYLYPAVYVQIAINIVTYMGLGLTLLFYRKLKKNDD